LHDSARTQDHAKKKTWYASERQTPAWEAKRKAYEQELKSIPLEDRVYLDESGVNCGMTREYGRAEKGWRAFGTRPKRRGENTTLAGIISGEGDFRVDALRLAMTGLKFLGFVAARVIQMLRPGQVVIIDNPRIHRVRGLRELIEGAGCRLLYLPTYSPELNPIEECWSKVKAGLRTMKARTQEALEKSVQAVAGLVTPQDIAGWFAHSDTFLASDAAPG
jgi:transposase